MASLDMSLDEMIKNSRNSQRGRGQGRARRGKGPGVPFRGARTAGAPRRNQLGVNAQPSALRIAKSFRKVKNLPWKNGLFEDGLKAAGLSELDAGTKLHVSNLDAGVTNEDIRELFLEIGELIRYGILYDKTGRPSGSAEVWFARMSDAVQALKKYNNVQLDGKPMKIEIVGGNAPEVALSSARVNVTGGANGPRRTVFMMPGRGFSRGGPIGVSRGVRQGGHANISGGSFRQGGRGRSRGGGRGRGRGGRGRGGVGGRGKKGVIKSADELDKELENYHSESMQT